MPVDRAERTPSKVERVLALRSFPGLAEVEATELVTLADVAKERSFARGAALLSPGEQARAMYLVRHGKVTILREGITARTYGGGDIVGAISLLSRDPAGQHVVAEEETRTFEIERADFEDVLEENFSLMLAALRGIMRTALAARLSIPGDAGFIAPVPEVDRPVLGSGLVDRVLFVRRLLTYGRARVEALAELARDMVEVRAPAGTELWRAGDRAPHSLLVWSGVVRCETDGAQHFRFGPDSVVGGVDSISGKPRWYRAVAETDLVALRSDVAHLIDVIEDHPDMGLDMLRTAARILTELHGKVDLALLATR